MIPCIKQSIVFTVLSDASPSTHRTVCSLVHHQAINRREHPCSRPLGPAKIGDNHDCFRCWPRSSLDGLIPPQILRVHQARNLPRCTNADGAVTCIAILVGDGAVQNFGTYAPGLRGRPKQLQNFTVPSRDRLHEASYSSFSRAVPSADCATLRPLQCSMVNGTSCARAYCNHKPDWGVSITTNNGGTTSCSLRWPIIRDRLS